VTGETALLEPGGRVLAVDDQDLNLELLREQLRSAGYEVETARDGEQALATLERTSVDCVVLDVRMPVLDGYEICRRIKAAPRTRMIPVVMLTGLSDVSDKVRGLEVGADDFLNRPVRRPELLARVKALVRIKRLRDELDTSETIIYTLVRALESKDARLGHSERVAAAAHATAVSLGLPPRDCDAVLKGALLHDLGKLAVPEAVLEAERPLAAEAEAAYREHPALGAAMLAPLRSLTHATDVVRQHHERLDGSGYPDGLAGDAFALPAELVAVANLYDEAAREAGRERAAAALREEAGRGAFRAATVEAFLRTGVAALGANGQPLADPWRDLTPSLPDPRAGHVLVCDDTPTDRELLAEILGGAGFRVSTVESGAAVLPAVVDRRPDLVLLDIRMPGLDGFDVCDWIKQSPETRFLPVVLLTAFSEEGDRLRSAQAGADDFVTLPVNRLELLARVRSLMRLRMYYRDLEAHQAVLVSLASVLEAKDPYTHGHSARVGTLTARLARRLGLASEECEVLRMAGLLHDIGKVGVPERLLNKPGALSSEEFRAVMTHPVQGATICDALRTVRAALPFIRFHHERYDGRGYPEGLRGDAIPLGARILGVADAFDALTSKRSYRDPLSRDAALELLAKETADGRWDPAVYAALAAMLREEAAQA
jgi:putative two-component system response regulator